MKQKTETQKPKQLEYMCELIGYQCYRNTEGFIEGYKKTGKILDKKEGTRSDLKRIVTNATNEAEFIKYVNGLKHRSVRIKEDKGPALFDINEL